MNFECVGTRLFRNISRSIYLCIGTARDKCYVSFFTVEETPQAKNETIMKKKVRNSLIPQESRRVAKRSVLEGEIS